MLSTCLTIVRKELENVNTNIYGIGKYLTSINILCNVYIFLYAICEYIYILARFSNSIIFWPIAERALRVGRRKHRIAIGSSGFLYGSSRLASRFPRLTHRRFVSLP
jgi:hypothetical protein